MKSIYDIILETKDIDNVWTVVGPDGSIASVWPDEAGAREEADKLNKEVKGNSFKVEKSKADEYIED